MTELVRGVTMAPFPGATVVSLGNFDGLHRGHQVVLDAMRTTTAQLAKSAGSARSVLISFYPHPSIVLGRVAELPRITTLRQNLQILSQNGVDVLYLLHFTPALSNLSAADFLQQICFDRLQASHMVLGPDTAFGKNRLGTGSVVAELLREAGKSCEILSFFEIDGLRISSRAVREHVAQGRVAEAAQLLGRPFALDGRVVRGEQRGRLLGFPTANIRSQTQVLPALGVYATQVRIDGQMFDSVTNVGVRPTFGPGVLSVETHILDWSGDCYGRRLNLAFIDKIRAEQTFPGIDALKAQIVEDVTTARAIFARQKTLK